MSKKKIEKFVGPIGRAQYVHLIEPDNIAFEAKGRKVKPDNKYKITFYVNKKTDTTALEEVCKAAAKKEWGDVDLKTIKFPFKDGDTKEGWEGAEGNYYLILKSQFKPFIVGADGKTILEPDRIYNGCFVRPLVSPYAFINLKDENEVTLRLIGIQFVKDGEPFTSGRSGNEFGEISEAELAEEIPF